MAGLLAIAGEGIGSQGQGPAEGAHVVAGWDLILARVKVKVRALVFLSMWGRSEFRHAYNTDSADQALAAQEAFREHWAGSSMFLAAAELPNCDLWMLSEGRIAGQPAQVMGACFLAFEVLEIAIAFARRLETEQTSGDSFLPVALGYVADALIQADRAVRDLRGHGREQDLLDGTRRLVWVLRKHRIALGSWRDLPFTELPQVPASGWWPGPTHSRPDPFDRHKALEAAWESCQRQAIVETEREAERVRLLRELGRLTRSPQRRPSRGTGTGSGCAAEERIATLSEQLVSLGEPPGSGRFRAALGAGR
jgi:hypothetical protein